MTPNDSFVLLMVAVVAAALLLWLRDRRRDRAGMPQGASKEAERRLRRSKPRFSIVGEVAAAIGVLASVLRRSAYVHDLLYGAAFAGFVWLEWKRYTGARGSARERELPESPASSVPENWRPPGMPPPIG